MYSILLLGLGCFSVFCADLKLKIFEEQKLFKVFVGDSAFGNDSYTIATINPVGLDLIVQDYAIRYKTNIDCLKHRKISIFDISSFDLSVFLPHIAKDDLSQEEYRCCWLLPFQFEAAGSVHCVPIFYFRNRDKKAFFIADSLGYNSTVASMAPYNLQLMANIERFFSEHEHDIFFIQHQRQASYKGCFTDALVWAKLLTGKKDEKFLIPDILNFLSENSLRDVFSERRRFNVNDQMIGHFIPKCNQVACLPWQLLKTAQTNKFINIFVKNNQDIGSLLDFLKPYLITIGKKEFKDYLRQKGWKYVQRLLYLFYVDQISTLIKIQFGQNYILDQEVFDPLKKLSQDKSLNLRLFLDQAHNNYDDFNSDDSNDDSNDITKICKKQMKNIFNLFYQEAYLIINKVIMQVND